MKGFLSIIFSALIFCANAQVEDQFSDGDFTNSPSWNGSNADFYVNPSFQLQLNAVAAGHSYLSVPVNVSFSNTVEWRFFIRQDFSPSTSNYSKVYLSSNNSDLTQPLDGYFLRFGEALTNDAIELFKQDSNSVTSVCRAANGLIANAFSAGVKVVRHSSGNWTLSVDYSGGENYNVEAGGFDDSFLDAQWIGVNCAYTSGNITKFYFDGFYAGLEIHDTIPPFVTSVQTESDSILSIIFSEKMDFNSLQYLNHYSVDNGIGNPINIEPDIADPLKYYLGFQNTFQPNISCNIFISGLMDQSLNQMLDQNAQFIYSPQIEASLNDIVINEIYFEPSSVSPLPYAEYIEIFNRKDTAVSLSNWTISDGNSTGTIESFNLGPKQYAVLYSDDDSAEFVSIQNGIRVHDFPSLNNDVGDHIILNNTSGKIINELIFNDNLYHDGSKNDGGWSIERIDPDFACGNENNWKASFSPGHGTPGMLNSVNGILTDNSQPYAASAYIEDSNSVVIVFSEDVFEGEDDISNYRITDQNGTEINSLISITSALDSVTLKFSSTLEDKIYTVQISELVKDCPGNAMQTFHTVRFGYPEPALTNDVLINELLFYSNDGGNDFVELYNASDKTIDIRDWTVSESDYSDSSDVKETCKISSGRRLFFPGDFIVLSEDEKKVKAFYDCLDPYTFINVSSMPDFNSDEGRVIINDESGTVIDAFRFSDNMHFPLISETRGISLERLGFKDSQWHSAAATAGFATPGYGNSQQLGVIKGEGQVSVDGEIFSPDNDGYRDVLPIHYQFPQAGTVLSLNVFDLNGQPVRTILDGETVSSDGILAWDGLKDDNQIAPSGIYILLAKSFDLDGNDGVFKKSFFLTRKY